jgi:hypothetical protein
MWALAGYSRETKDQHQLASSRAIATSATSGFLSRCIEALPALMRAPVLHHDRADAFAGPFAEHPVDDRHDIR